MPTVEKIIEKMKRTPNSITFRELDRVLSNKGFDVKRQNGSHVVYHNTMNNEMLVIPKHNPIKECYIDAALIKIGEKHE